MSLTKDIITILRDDAYEYSRMKQAMSGQFRSGSRKAANIQLKDKTVRTLLSRLKARGLVANDGGKWRATQTGKDYYEEIIRKNEKRATMMRGNRKKLKNTIVVFDIPEHKRNQRAWLRESLLVLGFEPIQKSVWFGPGPLPKDFIKEVGKAEIAKDIKFFKASPEDVADLED